MAVGTSATERPNSPGAHIAPIDNGAANLPVVPSDPAAGFGMIKVPRTSDGSIRRLVEFDAASLLQPKL